MLRNADDFYYREIRDLNFAALETTFRSKLTEIDELVK